MKIRRFALAVAASTFALGGLVAVATPAQADTAWESGTVDTAWESGTADTAWE